MDYVIDLVTADDYHIETVNKTFDCLALAIDWANLQVGKKHTNGSVIGKVKIHQHGDETEDDCIVIER